MRRNPDVEAELYAQREWEFARRYPEPKLVVIPAWQLRLVREAPEPRPYTGRLAVCPRCAAGPPSALLLAFYPGMVEERPGEENNLYIHECERGKEDGSND